MPAILVTGAGGYIGGSIVSDLAYGEGGLAGKATIHAAVRSEEQARSLSELNVKVLQVDLSDGQALAEYIVGNDIDIVINAATSIDPDAVLNLISALAKRQSSAGKESYLVHTSGQSVFDENTGWPFGEVKDTDAVFDLEKKSSDSYVVRQVDTFTVEQAKAHGVTAFIVMPPTIHGRGTGTWNKFSPQLPGLIRAAIASKKVHKFSENREAPLVHISDLTTFFALLTNGILEKKNLPSGNGGYYFTASHRVRWWDIMGRLAEALHARGLVEKPRADIWPNDEGAAEALGVPAKFAHSIWNSGPKAVGVNPSKVEWKPIWDGEKLLQQLDDEIKDVLELGTPKSSLLGSLNPDATK